MVRHLLLLAIVALCALGQEPSDVMTNDTVIRLVQSGVPPAIIIKTIGAAEKVDFRFAEMQRLVDAKVPDDVIKAMAAKAKGPGVSDHVAGAADRPPLTVQPATAQLPHPEPHIDAGPAGQGGLNKPRIFVTDSNSWEIAGGFGASSSRRGGSAGGAVAGGARPQTVEVIKTFGEKCPGVVVTMDKAQAQYVVMLDHEGGKGYARRDNKIAVFRSSGDIVYSGSTRSLGNAVKDACEAIFR